MGAMDGPSIVIRRKIPATNQSRTARSAATLSTASSVARREGNRRLRRETRVITTLSYVDRNQLAAKDEEHSPAQAERGPQIVELDWLPQKPDRERHKDAQRDYFLK